MTVYALEQAQPARLEQDRLEDQVKRGTAAVELAPFKRRPARKLRASFSDSPPAAGDSSSSLQSASSPAPATVAQASPSAAPLYPPFNAGAQASPSAAAEEIAVEESQDSEGDY